MKTIIRIFTCILALLMTLTPGQAQVTWTGPATGGSWATTTNWSSRAVPTATDSIVLSSTMPDTLIIFDIPTAVTLLRLRITNTTKVKFWSMGTLSVFTISGGAGADVVIDSLASLTCASSSVIGGAGAININLATGATAEIGGKLHFTTNTASSANAHRLQGLTTNAITFKNGSVFTMGPGASGNPFGAGTGASSPSSAYFDSGSAFVFNGGSNPFAMTAPASVTIFHPNSTFKINTPGTTSPPALSGRTYGNIEVTNPSYAGSSAGAGALTVNGNLTVSAGAITMNISGGINIKGNITVASGATAAFGAGVLVTLNGETEQVLTNNGKLTFADATTILKLNNAAGARLGSAANIETLTLTNGNLTLYNNHLTVTTLTGGSATSHVVTNGTGQLKRSIEAGATATFPIGATATTYDPVVATPTTATTLGASVSNTINPTHIIVPAGAALVGSREWDLSSSTPSATVLAFTPSDTRAVPTAGVKIGQWNSATAKWQESAATYATGTWTATTSLFLPTILTEANAIIIIPVEFQNISATAKGKINVIDWSTASEKNMKEFAVERSMNNKTWEVMGTKAATGGTSPAYYSFEDNTPTLLTYYRIRSIETDGKDQASKVVAVKREGGKLVLISVTPVPTTEGVTIDFSVGKTNKVTVIMTDIVGRIVESKTFGTLEGANSVRLNLSNSAQGTYIMTLNDGETVVTQRIVKQ
jgi:Secretion system C-terminal sorting domain